MKRIIWFLAFLPLLCGAQETLSLAGAWDLSLGDSTAYNDYVILPGSMLTNGKGDIVTTKTQWTGSLYDSSFYFNPYMEKYRHEGEMKFPFFLTPERHYTGKAWYKRTVYIPQSMKGEQVTLFLERPHIETTVYVNGKEVGHQMSLSVPHRYDISRYLRFGTRNTIAICVYNGIENVCVGQDSHSVTDQTQGNWNGIVGRIELQVGPVIWRKRVIPHLEANFVEIIVNETSYFVPLKQEAIQWDEFHPQLYQHTVYYEGMPVDVTFGLRDIRVEGSQLLINGRPLYLRGTVENCCFPETGYPPTDEEEWLEVFAKCKAYGLNHVRFHSYCPPEAAFAAADRVGIYLQPEGPSWPNHGVKLRNGQKIDKYLMEETKRIIDEYGHHPSFCMMAAGNEPAGDWVTYCNDWVKAMKQYDPTKIYAGASVGGGWAWDDGSEYHVKAGARGLDWDKHAPHSDDDYYQQLLFPRNYKSTEPNHSPIVAHEQGQWCAFPDFKEISQYHGAYKAKNFEIFRDLLADNGMAEMAEKFLMASGRLQTLCYKYETERNLRTKDYAGFQYLGINDYSGQGTALVGPLNVHWREKGYCTADDWRQFCNIVVPLAKFPKFVYTNDEQLSVDVEAYNAYSTPFSDVTATYVISNDSNQIISDGTLFSGPLPVGKNIPLGTVALSLGNIQAPAKLTLTVQLSQVVKNHWDFWVYPQPSDLRPQPSDIIHQPSAIYETDTLDAKALQVLKQGGDVLLTAGGKIRYGNDVRHTFLPVFWNTSWFKMRPPHTTGAYIQNTHPVFRDFPTDDWQNLNWWELVNRTQVMNLAEFPKDFQPIVQPIDTWHVSRKLGMLLEARVLNGRLLMTTLPVSPQPSAITHHPSAITPQPSAITHHPSPVARQLRYSILRYMASDDFQPTTTVSVDVIRHLFEREAPAVNMFTNESPDELKPKIK
ncbi:MAG: beta-glucuronidase [Prevotella sp.]|nr:beta-glucuronidase [Prevotella sp.]